MQHPTGRLRGRAANGSLLVRSMQTDDIDALAQIFYRSVHDGAKTHYDTAQRTAWAPQVPTGRGWATRLISQETVVAVSCGQISGFMSLDTARGYLDLAFVLPEFRGHGVADALYLVVESRARAAGLAKLTTDASHLAKPFFTRFGWSVLAPQTVERGGVALQNWQMSKQLVPGTSA